MTIERLEEIAKWADGDAERSREQGRPDVAAIHADLARCARALKDMREVLIEVGEVLRKQGRDPGTYHAKNFDEQQVLAIAEHHGYGNLMVLLASKWYGKVRGGAFSVGECVATNASLARKIATALEAVEAEGGGK